MKRHAPIVLLLLALGALVAGLAMLFQLRLSRGDVFAPYSSLRADPLGLRVLHDSLARVTGVSVERSFTDIADWPADPPRTIVLAGLRRADWTEVTRAELDALEATARGGSRLVITFRAHTARTKEEIEEQKKHEEAMKRRRKLAEDDEETAVRERREKLRRVDLARRWAVDVKERMLLDRSSGASRAVDVPASLPGNLPWRSDLYFALADETTWRVLYRRGSSPVMIERDFGRGSIVIAADSYFLSNEAMQKDREPALLAWMVGSHRRVQFDEAHLGMVAQPGVAALARRYGLSGAFFTLLLLAALFVWRRMALFVPPTAGESVAALAYHPAAGLEALLRRAVPVGDLMAACLREWKPGARATERARVEAALVGAPKHASAATLYNAAVRALRRR